MVIAQLAEVAKPDPSQLGSNLGIQNLGSNLGFGTLQMARVYAKKG